MNINFEDDLGTDAEEEEEEEEEISDIGTVNPRWQDAPQQLCKAHVKRKKPSD